MVLLLAQHGVVPAVGRLGLYKVRQHRLCELDEVLIGGWVDQFNDWGRIPLRSGAAV